MVGSDETLSPSRHVGGWDQLGKPEVQHLCWARRVSKMFAGFRSRWMIPDSCAASSASAFDSTSLSGALSIGLLVIKCLGSALPRTPLL
jgi:hypothetical protein